MSLAIHLPSQTHAKVIGTHFGMRATLVRLQSGQEQYWKNDYIQILEETEVSTNKVMIRLSGPKHNTWQVIERVFETMEEASSYLQELTRFNEVKSYSESEETCSLTNGWSMSANYSIKKILKAMPAPKALPDWYPFDLRRQSPALSTSGDVPLKRNDRPASTSGNGKVVKLQDLVKEPRKARVILRSLVSKKKISKPARWEWEEGSEDLATVRVALKPLL